MRKFLFWILSAFLFVSLPALAQRNGGGHAQARGNGHAVEQHAAPARGEAHTEGRGARDTAHAQYHYSQGGSARAYWRGGRFDHNYFVGHWGSGNRFYWGSCNWYGPRFGVGSWFWFNGAGFEIIDPIPPYWYDGEVYVEYVDGYGYVLVNPTFPGVYYHVGVRF